MCYFVNVLGLTFISSTPVQTEREECPSVEAAMLDLLGSPAYTHNPGICHYWFKVMSLNGSV